MSTNSAESLIHSSVDRSLMTGTLPFSLMPKILCHHPLAVKESEPTFIIQACARDLMLACMHFMGAPFRLGLEVDVVLSVRYLLFLQGQQRPATQTSKPVNSWSCIRNL